MRKTHLNAKGLKCPLPVLRAGRALRSMAPGDVLIVEADDAAAWRDMPAFCAAAGHELQAATQNGAVLHFIIVRGADRRVDDEAAQAGPG